MAISVTKGQVLNIYKSMLRESQKLSNYNFRTYALRKIRDAFKDSKSITDPKMIKKEFNYASDNLQLIKRQAIVGDLYKTEKLVIENLR